MAGIEKAASPDDTPPVAVQSLARATAIMDCVSRHPNGIGLAQLAREVGLHASTTFHLARSMAVLELLRQDPESKRYKIGPKIFSLAASVLSETELIDIAKPTLSELADRVLGAAQIAILAGSNAVVIGKYEGFGRFSVQERSHAVTPAPYSAAGMIMLAALPDDGLDTFFGRHGPFHGGKSDVAALRARLAEVRSTGIAIDNGEFDPELVRLAAPIHSFRGDVIAALGVSIPMWRLDANGIEDIVAPLRETAAELSRRLGHSR
jgi:DNA-binding IclR family transcriptional regulator